MIARFFSLIFFMVSSVCLGQTPEKKPLTIVIFGAGGDLSTRKIFPALSNLAKKGDLPEHFAIVAVERGGASHKEFHSRFPEMDPSFLSRIFYSQVDLKEKASYENLKEVLTKIERSFGGKSNRLYFLSVPPSLFGPVIEHLDEKALISSSSQIEPWTRVMVEKPFGHDLASAVELQKKMALSLDESQIYRIDHYLGKVGLQNLLAFREEESFERKWNRKYIDHVQITLSEKIGIGSRAHFWEETGLLRDVFQNHLLQMLALFSMDLPQEKGLMNEEKIRLLEAVRPISQENLVRGQYIQGESGVGYLQEIGVPKTSQVETYSCLKLWIENERWEGVPFYLRAGKRLSKQTGEIAVFFKNDPHPLIIRVQPNPGIYYREEPLKLPTEAPEAYETLLLKCIEGNREFFVEKEEQFAAWKLLTPLLQSSINPVYYPAGSFGPKEADHLIQKDGREWVNYPRLRQRLVANE